MMSRDLNPMIAADEVPTLMTQLMTGVYCGYDV